MKRKITSKLGHPWVEYYAAVNEECGRLSLYTDKVNFAANEKARLYEVLL